MVTCSIDGCDRPKYCRGWCRGHYRKWATLGDPSMGRELPRDDTAQARLYDRTEWDGTCRVFTGQIMRKGYGRLSLNGQHILAHRLAWTLEVGPIPDGMQLDHVCGNRRCTNVAHLRLATPAGNCQARVTIAASSGYRNVYFHKGGQCWVAAVTAYGIRHHLGTFATASEANDAATAARLRLHELHSMADVSSDALFAWTQPTG